MSSSPAESPVLVEVVRGDLVESRHRVRVAVTARDGELQAGAGDPDAPMFARSSLKPFQAIAMVSQGLDLEGSLLALAAASHSGEGFHLSGVRRILDGAGLTVDDLQNTPGLPLAEQARREWLMAGHGPESIAQNCSGKHAAMLRTCVRAGWDTGTYLDPQHPLQRAIAEVLEEYCHNAGMTVSTDGCGAPLFATSLTGVAHGFGKVAAATEGPAHELARAYRAHPEYASGSTGRNDLVLHRAVPGLVCKVGAEGVLVAGLPDGRGIAMKVEDGAERALLPLMAVVVGRMLGTDALTELTTAPVLGHGKPVGEIRPAEAAAELLSQL